MTAMKHPRTFNFNRSLFGRFTRRFLAAGGLVLALLFPALVAAQTPPKPTLTVAPGDDQVYLTAAVTSNGGSPITRWEYRQKSTGNYSGWVRIARSNANSITRFIVSNLTNDTTYTFQVRAVNNNGNGLSSDEVTGTPVAKPSLTPAKPTIGTIGEVSSAGVLSVPWTWTDTTSNCTIEGYRIQYRKSSEKYWRMAPNTANTGQYTIDLASNKTTSPYSTTTAIGPNAIGTGSSEEGVTLDTGASYVVRVSVTSGTGSCDKFSDWSDAQSSPSQANGAPVVANAIADQSVTVGGTATVALASVFSDPDGDSLTLSALSSDTAKATVAISSTTLTLTGVAAGTANVTVTANDGNLSVTDTFVVTVSAANQAPTVDNAIADQSVTVGETNTVALASVFSDPDGDSLTLSALSSDTAKATVAISSTTLTLTGVAAGTATITVTANDGNLSVTDTFVVTVSAANQAPTVANAIADQSVTVGGTTTVALASVFSDPDGDSLTLSALSSDTAKATVAISSTTLTLTGVAAGTATITVTANDGNLSVTDTFVVTVTPQPIPNRAPVVASPIADQSLTTGGTTTVALASVFSDPDGDSLTLSALSSDTAKATVAISGTTLTLTGVTVTPQPIPNRAPVVASPIADQSLTTGGTTTVALASVFSDPDGDSRRWNRQRHRHRQRRQPLGYRHLRRHGQRGQSGSDRRQCHCRPVRNRGRNHHRGPRLRVQRPRRRFPDPVGFVQRHRQGHRSHQ